MEFSERHFLIILVVYIRWYTHKLYNRLMLINIAILAVTLTPIEQYLNHVIVAQFIDIKILFNKCVSVNVFIIVKNVIYVTKKSMI